jgi:hypothetical protein
MERVPYVEEFLLWQSACGRSDATLRNHRAALRKFDRWLCGQDGATVQTVSSLDGSASWEAQAERAQCSSASRGGHAQSGQ